MIRKLKEHQFLFEELVKRDFKKKYKRTVLGMFWSMLSPLLNLLVMALVFTQFFGRNSPHYIIYLFSGNIVMSFYKESTKGGMSSLVGNASIFTKINVPKYLFLFSKNVSALINFGLTIIIYFLFVLADHITFHMNFFCLIIPIVCLVVMNIGIGMILSALYVFFRDIEYLYDIFLTLLTYTSAIFYYVDRFDNPNVRRAFLANPVYVYIKYFRTIVIDGNIPSLAYHGLCFFYALLFLGIGCWFYKHYNKRFLYYV
ncbi:ABC-2 type transport system permease protein [Lachnospiraceae bacterium]|nr:ABC-2 type transport system permease protein [Lachnospiraceae bacterium]